MHVRSGHNDGGDQASTHHLDDLSTIASTSLVPFRATCVSMMYTLNFVVLLCVFWGSDVTHVL
jgi:hypothetical protein